MKLFKSILPLLALVFGVAAAFAFTPKNAMPDPIVFYFQGGPTDDVDDPNNYSTTPVEGVTCGGDGIVCQITAESDGNSPAKPLFDVGYTVSSNPTHYSMIKRVDN